MARHWSEPLDCNCHRNHMGLGGSTSVSQPAQNIVRPAMFFVEVAGFTFEFLSIAQIEAALEFFSQKVRPTSRWPYPVAGMSHWEAQRWYERLPGRLFKEPRRVKVVAALEAALAEFSRGTPEAG